MTQEHPIIPPPELVEQWYETADNSSKDVIQEVAAQAARWGSDQELEACCADLQMVLGPNQANWLRSVRRPKPPSLKEQALDDLDLIQTHDSFGFQIIDLSTIRRALESLPE